MRSFGVLSKHDLSVGLLERRSGVFSFFPPAPVVAFFVGAGQCRQILSHASFSCLIFIHSVCSLRVSETMNLKVNTLVSEGESFDRQYSGIHLLLGKVIHEE